MNIKFLEGTDTNGAPAKTITQKVWNPTTRSYSYNQVITINTNVFQTDGSQEYQTAIILHEAIHGYFLASGSNIRSQSAQHTNMVNLYVDPFAQLLIDLYGTDREQAYALAFNGVEDANPDDYNTALVRANMNIYKVKGYYENHRAGLYGKKCNN